jgi:hypothetical protein
VIDFQYLVIEKWFLFASPLVSDDQGVRCTKKVKSREENEMIPKETWLLQRKDCCYEEKNDLSKEEAKNPNNLLNVFLALQQCWIYEWMLLLGST